MRKSRVTALFLAVQMVLPTLSHAQGMDHIFNELNLFVDQYVAENTLPFNNSSTLLIRTNTSNTGSGLLPNTNIEVANNMLQQAFSGQKGTVHQYAYEQLGKKYRYGAYGPEEFDCSGLIYHVFGLAGKKVPRTSQAQSEGGVAVEKKDLRIGDLVFFDTRHTGDLNNIKIDTDDIALFANDVSGSGGNAFSPNKVTHSGIYIGDGKFIHASSGSVMKVVVEELESKYFAQRYLFARRYE